MSWWSRNIYYYNKLLSQRPQTHLQDDHCLAKEAEGKGDGLAKHISRPKPYWASVGHPQTEGGGA